MAGAGCAADAGSPSAATALRPPHRRLQGAARQGRHRLHAVVEKALIDLVGPSTAEYLLLSGESRSRLSQRATEEVVRDLVAGGGAAVVDRWYRRTMTAGELAEGVAAVAERRRPRFPGQADEPFPFRSLFPRGTRMLRRSPPEAGIGAAFRRAANWLPARP